MKSSLIQVRLSIVIAALTVGIAVVRPGSTEQTRAEEARRVARSTLTDLRNLDELKATFNRDAGKVRLVLLLSPT